ncbi:MAG TPA: ribosome silencing factor [Candidatus Eremiobacteraceae bacterium]|nr:ribosome silencing factor [Candidatus Eremiobacteraceae bacterium]
MTGRPKKKVAATRITTRQRESLAPKRAGIASASATVKTLTDAEVRRLADDCRAAAVEKKAEAVLVLDIRKKAAFADYFVVATGRSIIQARAIADAVVEASETKFGSPVRVEGYKDGTWILVDYGAVIVHVFTPPAREFYNLERLWGKPAAARR